MATAREGQVNYIYLATQRIPYYGDIPDAEESYGAFTSVDNIFLDSRIKNSYTMRKEYMTFLLKRGYADLPHVSIENVYLHIQKVTLK